MLKRGWWMEKITVRPRRDNLEKGLNTWWSMSWGGSWGRTDLWRMRSTALAVLASRPVVGSSRKRTEGEMISSIPILQRLRSPPETPLMNSVPTWIQPYSVRTQTQSYTAGVMSSIPHLGVCTMSQTKFVYSILHPAFFLFHGNRWRKSEVGRKHEVLFHSEGSHDDIILTEQKNEWCEKG